MLEGHASPSRQEVIPPGRTSIAERPALITSTARRRPSSVSTSKSRLSKPRPRTVSISTLNGASSIHTKSDARSTPVILLPDHSVGRERANQKSKGVTNRSRWPCALFRLSMPSLTLRACLNEIRTSHHPRPSCRGETWSAQRARHGIVSLVLAESRLILTKAQPSDIEGSGPCWSWLMIVQIVARLAPALPLASSLVRFVVSSPVSAASAE
jgi:hypothetical protein